MSAGAAPGRVRAVGLVLFDGVTALDLGGPLEVFATANDVVARAGGTARYDLRVLGVGRRGAFAAE